MAYFRGNPYIWSDSGDNLHIWMEAPDLSCGELEGRWKAAINVPARVFDQLAVMRVAELIRDGRVKQVIAEAIKEQGGNGGCSALEAGFLFGKRKR